VLTPHPGEFGRLTGLPVRDVQADRQRLAARFAGDNGIVCVLKGCGTVVTDGKELYRNTTGNPGMATGGTGDVLAGMIGALIGQVTGPALLHAAAAGVFLHGLAGDIAAAERSEAALAAGDIIDYLPQAFLRLKNKRKLT
jgi:NAD(P)H-hydrate epimerase